MLTMSAGLMVERGEMVETEPFPSASPRPKEAPEAPLPCTITPSMNEMILRKGAVSAKLGEKLLIPINMRDGSLICIGKGNDEWNCSAPHGAGRLMSRSAAFEKLTMEEYEKQMEGIYTTCVNSSTLDESPMAYKNMDEIVANIEPTAEIVAHIKPIYNFKAAE